MGASLGNLGLSSMPVGEQHVQESNLPRGLFHAQRDQNEFSGGHSIPREVAFSGGLGMPSGSSMPRDAACSEDTACPGGAACPGAACSEETASPVVAACSGMQHARRTQHAQGEQHARVLCRALLLYAVPRECSPAP
jgi:hypothetical protein